MKRVNTLWGILNQFGIEVPPIQRDFAQGRETNHAKKVRKNFLDSIFVALNEDKPLALDFVYGKIHGLKNAEDQRKNKNAIQSLINSVRDYALTIDLTIKDITVEDKSTEKSDLVYLIPLDGQQRLTTLFLVHWYIAKRSKVNDTLKVLNRFRYKTRKSSSSFLKLLTDCNLDLKFDLDDNENTKKLYNEIINLEYFSSSWLNDPTVKAMLIMLQDIHTRLQSNTEEDFKHFWSNLTEKNLLWFDFLDLKDFNLSDELYVKMNARGKQLSSFENFKAWLFGLIQEKKIIKNEEWELYSKKFDIEWNDIFWNHKDENVFDIDDVFFNYFKILYLYDNVKSVNLNGTNFDKDSREVQVFDAVLNNKHFDWEFLCNDFFNDKIENYLQILSLCEDFKVENRYLNDFFEFQFSKNGNKPTWPNLIKNFITLSFIETKGIALNNYSDQDFQDLNEYHRILFNLFDNTIIDNPSLYQNAIKEIEQLNHELKRLNYSFADWIDKLEYTSKSVFTEQQVLEEILKFRLFQNYEWKNLILEAENVTYFGRQLNFWFFRVGISIRKEDFHQSLLLDTKSKQIFEDTTKKNQLLFNEKEINRTENFSERIFERALLSKSDYLLNEKGYKCFVRNSGRDVSWKRLFFRDRNSEQTNQALLEIFDLDFSNAKKDFEAYIEKNISENSIEKWRKAFILNQEIFKYLGDLRYIRKIDNHGWVIIKDSYKTYLGPHYELFSLDLYLKYLKGKEFLPFNKIDYFTAPKNNLEEFPCAFLDWKTESFNYALDVKFINGNYCLIFFTRNVAITDSISQILLALDYIYKDGYYFKDLSSELETLDEIKLLSQKLI